MTEELDEKARWDAEIEQRLAAGNGLEFTLEQFASAVGGDPSGSQLKAYFYELVSDGNIEAIPAFRCPVETCMQVLPPEGAPYTQCPGCHADYQELGVEPVEALFYRLSGESSRDIRWMIVIHGMNSRAKWQEEFSWQIANRLRYSAPILIYKYGWATIDVLVKWMHRRLAKALGERIQIAVEQAAASDRPRRPDIVAHSFGTRLFQLILEDPNFTDLSFGRVITAGSIIKPDFDWEPHIKSGRVEAVLNHVAEKDSAVPFAQFAIPGSGPGGKFGYIDASVLNVRATGLGHSGFFEPAILRSLIADGGLWHSFLTHPLATFEPGGSFKVAPPKWKPALKIFRLATRSLGIILFVLVGPLSWLRRRFDP